MIASNLSRFLRPVIRPRTALPRGASASTTSPCYTSFSSMSLSRPIPLTAFHPYNTFRTFSEAADVSDSTDSTEAENTPNESESTPRDQPRRLPTRHSRHHSPAIAPVQILKAETNEILNSSLGSLFGTLWCIDSSL